MKIGLLARLSALAILATVVATPALGDAAIQAQFATSIANRLDMGEVSCGDTTFWEQHHIALFCYQHRFGDFESFVSAWNKAVVWDGVIAPDAKAIQELRGYGKTMIGNWDWFTQDVRKTAGTPVAFEGYSTTYTMHAGKWGFDGHLLVNIEFGQDRLGHVNWITLMFTK